MRYNYDVVKKYEEDVIVSGINGKIIIGCRVNRDSIPEGKFLYEVRHSVDSMDEPVVVEDSVIVNFYGTLIMDVEIPLDSTGCLFITDTNFDIEFN